MEQNGLVQVIIPLSNDPNIKESYSIVPEPAMIATKPILGGY